MIAELFMKINSISFQILDFIQLNTTRQYLVMQANIIRQQQLLRTYLAINSSHALFKQGDCSLANIHTLAVDFMDKQYASLIKIHCPNLKKVQIKNSFSAFIQKFTQKILMKSQTQAACNIFDQDISVLNNIKNLKNLKSLINNDNTLLCFNDFPHIEEFGYLRKIDQKTVIALKGLKCLSSLKIIKHKISIVQIQIVVQNLAHLRFLSIQYSELGDEHLKVISDHILHLQHLDIASNRVTSKGLHCLSKYSKTLQKIVITKNQYIDTQGMVFITTTFTNLKQIIISFFQLSDKILLLIAKHLHKMQSFQMLGFNDMLDSKCIEELITKSPQLKHLMIQNFFQKTKKIYKSLSQVVAQYLPKLESIHLCSRYNKIYDSQCYYLSKIKTFRKIMLSYNLLGDWGAMKIIRNTSKTNCNFSYNLRISKKAKRNINFCLQLSRHGIIYN